MSIGMNSTTPVVVKQVDGKFEARVGFAMFGSTNMTDAEMDEAERNPFHEKWYDNFSSGTGNTEEEARANLQANINDIYESIWL